MSPQETIILYTIYIWFVNNCKTWKYVGKVSMSAIYAFIYILDCNWNSLAWKLSSKCIKWNINWEQSVSLCLSLSLSLSIVLCTYEWALSECVCVCVPCICITCAKCSAATAKFILWHAGRILNICLASLNPFPPPACQEAGKCTHTACSVSVREQGGRGGS